MDDSWISVLVLPIDIRYGFTFPTDLSTAETAALQQEGTPLAGID
jgi:hypothetical protein